MRPSTGTPRRTRIPRRGLARRTVIVVAVAVGVAVAVALATVASGCAVDGGPSSRAAGPGTGSSALGGSLTVSAAASLTEAFSTLRDEFVAAHPGTEVTINFASSGTLSTQILDGAPADIAAFADTMPMTALADAGLLAGPPEVFARNQLVLVTQPGNPAGISELADLATAGVVSLCVETAPCGKLADELLARSGVTVPAGSISRGADVKATLTAVSEGDAVVGIVYLTDAATIPDRVDTVELPDARDLLASYPIAVLAGSAAPELAAAFESFVRSGPGQLVLRDAGFLAP
ncbi:MAG: molybdate ABC transporter substrate-binding protein [Microthrixaceae bacterium]